MENLSGPRRSLAVYFTSALSNRGLIRDAKEDLQNMAQVIFPNTLCGFLEEQQSPGL
ncbi:hypothetical protein ERO13_D01G169044v2 [Gossypium hirsutum]|uniref:Uncharacterized protein n=1 Tax=Gossypium tomentosum TaxID=34277 RepID=A0A5D2MC26_GOSTO|nr:hypothetical protein ERO13_D01G169044v2 [Gossypium hirsutum]TYH88896.1 hypothetical protein ES332_D01G220500v1 [Gossypium tomentosum]